MAIKAQPLGKWIAPARFMLFVLAFAAAGFGAHLWYDWRHAAMIGFDFGAVVFLLSCVSLLNDTPAIIRRKAKENDANRGILLAVTGLVSIVVLVTIGAELAGKSESGPPVVLIVATLTLAWLFSNVIYAVHYAHLYYSQKPGTGGDAAGIDFPGDDQPDYSDFIYFAFTLGMTFQTSDTAIEGRGIRRVAIVHSFAAFVFNIGVLAFTINILGAS